MKRYSIECGVAQPSTSDAIAMDVQGAGKNVKLRIDYISRTMLGNVPDLLVDLLEVASYVYCADQRLGRGSDQLTNFGEDWRRSLHFSIPVRQLNVWQDPEVQEQLAKTVGFLSDDSYEFTFRQAETPAQPKELYFSDLIDTTFEHDEVALFSGGIDSFAGSAHDIIKMGKSITLVGHYSSTKVRAVQENLVDGFKKRGFERQVSYIPVWVSNENERAHEFTQRTRSFLFACLGIVVARMAGKDRFTFYENGVVSINPPLAGDVIGGRATRTTHPQVLRGLESLFSLLLERTIEIQTPLQWMTKQEVTQLIAAAGLSDMLAQTASCTRPRTWTNKQKHCGVCSQCIDRRFAVLSAGLGAHEPSGNYVCDLLVADRSADDDLRMALSYVAFFQKISATSKDRFVVDFPEVTSAIGHFPGLTADAARTKLHEMFQRQAKAVEEVITGALVEHRTALFRNELPSGSLLAMCFNRNRVVTEPPSGYDAQMKAFVDRLSAPVLEFAVDETNARILFHGGDRLDESSYRIVLSLIANFRSAKATSAEIPFIRTSDLATAMNIDEQSLRQQVSRLRKAIEPLAVKLGIPMDQNTFIETKERAGYRINPECREISVADVRAADRALRPG